MTALAWRVTDIGLPREADGHLRIAEAGDGPPVVLLHGAGLGASGPVHYRANTAALVGAGYRVIVPDLLGFGNSAKPVDAEGYPLARFTDTLAFALKAINIGRAAFVGNSLGGAVSIDMALRYPDLVSRAALLAPGAMESRETYFAQPGVQAMLSYKPEALDQQSMRRMLEGFACDPSIVDDALVTARLKMADGQPGHVLATLALPDLTPRLPELTLPLLVIWGARDGICPVSGAMKFATSCANADVTILANTGHWPMSEQAATVNAALLSFLSRNP